MLFFGPTLQGWLEATLPDQSAHFEQAAGEEGQTVVTLIEDGEVIVAANAQLLR